MYDILDQKPEKCHKSRRQKFSALVWPRFFCVLFWFVLFFNMVTLWCQRSAKVTRYDVIPFSLSHTTDN